MAALATPPPAPGTNRPDGGYAQSFLGQQLASFANGLAHRLAQAGFHVPAETFTAASREVFRLMTAKLPTGPAVHTRELQLVFRHDCLCALQRRRPLHAHLHRTRQPYLHAGLLHAPLLTARAAGRLAARPPAAACASTTRTAAARSTWTGSTW